jgi:hypothetical protein
MFSHYKQLVHKKILAFFQSIPEEKEQDDMSFESGHGTSTLEEVREPHKKKQKTTEIGLLPVKTSDD